MSPLLLLLAAAALAAEKEFQPETYSTSRMEAQAVLGELKYQNGDYSGADETFNDSLDASTKLSAPQGVVVAHDLYRTAEIAVRRGEVRKAKRNLEIIVSRFPDTDWADKAGRLLDAMEGRHPEARLDAEGLPGAIEGPTPESRLRRLQEALRAGRDEEALGWAEDFLQRHPSHPAAAEAWVARGLLQLSRKDAAGAVESLEGAARSKDPVLRGRAIYALGAAYHELNRPAQVLAAVPAADPSKTWDAWLAKAQVWRAASLERLGRGAEGAKVYASVADLKEPSPARAYALGQLAEARERTGDLKSALGLLARASSDARRFGLEGLRQAAQISEAHLLFRLNRYDDAADAYGTFSLQNPRHPQATQALYQQGLSLKKLDRIQEAVKALEALVKLHPESVYAKDAHLQLGQLYDAMGQKERAVEHYAKLDGAEGMLLTAQVHYNAKRYAQAIPLYRRYLETAKGSRAEEVADLLLAACWESGSQTDLAEALSAHGKRPVAAQIRWGLGGKAFKAKDFKTADEQLRALVLDFPRTPHRDSAQLMRAEALMQLGEARAAAAVFSKFLAENPKHPEARRASYRLALAQHEAGDYAAAAKGFAKVGGKDTMAADALLNQALALSKTGKKAGVLASYENFLTRFPAHSQSGAIWFEVAQLREQLGRVGPAAAAYEKAAPSRGAEAVFALARCQEKLGKKAAALKTYERLAAMTPAGDTHRLGGVLRLGLMTELDAPLKAMKLYADVVKHAQKGTPTFATALKRLNAITADGSLVAK